MHAIGVVGLAASNLPSGLVLVLVAGLLVHAWRRAPAEAPLLLVTERGTWSVPDAGLYDRELDPGSAWTPLWVRLVLADAPRRHALVLLRCEYGPADWRRIRLALREAGGPF